MARFTATKPFTRKMRRTVHRTWMTSSKSATKESSQTMFVRPQRNASSADLDRRVARTTSTSTLQGAPSKLCLGGDFLWCMQTSKSPPLRLPSGQALNVANPRDVEDGAPSRFHRLSGVRRDRKSTRLNSSHLGISYAVFCLKK